MDLTATTATASSWSPVQLGLLVAAVLAVWTVGYAIACWLWPFAACKKCEGSGKTRSPSGKAFRDCRRCKGKARRLRTGRRAFNYLHITSKAANKT